MKLLIDDANVEKIKELIASFPIDGVTTNPTILSKAKVKPKDNLLKIRKAIGDDRDLHVQVVASSKDEIISQANRLVELLGENTYIKVPAYKEGFKAIEELSKRKIKTTATAIYSPMQAFMAAKAGARYLAPYINRIDNLGYDGLAIARKIQKILDNNDFDCQILAASFKNTNQILEIVTNTLAAVTVAPALFDNLIKDYNVEFAIKAFEDDFKKLIDGKSFLDIL